MRNLFVLLSILVIAGRAHGQDGAALYKTYCTICHEGPTADERGAGTRVAGKRLDARTGGRAEPRAASRPGRVCVGETSRRRFGRIDSEACVLQPSVCSAGEPSGRAGLEWL